MQNFCNYYDLLEVDQSATLAEIKQAFRRLARLSHPDRNPGDHEAEERFKQLSQAYEVLGDEERRAQYDRYSRFWQQEGFAPEPVAPEPSLDLEFGDYLDFNRFVDELLKDPVPGRVRPVRSATRSDPDATGSRPDPGFSSGSSPRSGSANPDRRTQDIEARLVVPLERAYGGGRERIRLEDGRSIEVNMPEGLVTGQKIRLRGQGIDGGDLYLNITVAEHSRYRLVGDDLYCSLWVTAAEAALGASIAVPTLSGPVTMVLPVGVKPGQRLRLADKGYPCGDGRYGDQIVEIQLWIPTRLSDLERDLYEQLRRLETNPRDLDGI
jgi:curved DNA-binding protein